MDEYDDSMEVKQDIWSSTAYVHLSLEVLDGSQLVNL